MSDSSWTLQLAPLASQHHLSEYSRIKYGHQGCPVSYTPLSIQLPDVVRTLRERQQKYVDQVLWWPCAQPVPASPIIPVARQRAALASGETLPYPELQQQISSALSDSITIPPSDTSPSYIKTSESHPINVSPIIPPESLVAISSHLIPCKKPGPVLFEIRPPYSLDRIASSYLLPSPHAASSVRIPTSHRPAQSNQLRSSLTGVLSAAFHTKLSLPPLPVPSSRILRSLKRTLHIRSVPDTPLQSDATDAIPSTPPSNQYSHSRLPSVLALPTTYALHPFSAHVRPPTAPSSPNKTSKPPTSKASRPFKLGNLLLSSCPGKKVRLDGPVRGRSAVCRDLGIDLRRMKMLGARCVVCCLDDDELELLIGVSWIEYCQVAHQEGLDVLRIPLPEGLAPLSPKSLDADLDRIIENYTLQGISALVHCRGGVGRAGLFACCWMLKLGLCGWIETDIPPSATSSSSVADTEIKRDHVPDTFQWDSGTVVRRDTLQLVERVIEVVRRRRSVKAIETLEQVQFLVEYVDYLRTCGRSEM